MLMVGLMLLAGASLFALTRKRPFPASPKAKATPSVSRRPDWRAARSESLTLEQAVREMSHHADMLQQLSGAWLTAANQWTTTPGIFRANVQRAQAMMLTLDDECLDTVQTLRDLERLHNNAAVFDRQRDQAHALADEADRMTARLHERLHTLATARGLDADHLVRQATTVSRRVDGSAVEQRLAAAQPHREPTLQEMLG